MRNSELETSARTILQRVPVRPTPQKIGRLIQEGLTSQHLYDAGEQLGLSPPVMDETFVELDTLLPYMYQASDTINKRYADAPLVIFADTAADLLYDYHLTRSPNAAATLLPASMAFLSSTAFQRLDIAEQFLKDYGVERAAVDNPERRVALIDAHYDDMAAKGIGRLIGRGYGLLYDHEDIDVSLVCPALPSNRVQPLIEIPAQTAAQVADGLPRVKKMLGTWYASNDCRAVPSPHPIQVSLSLMPRYHDIYYGMRELQGVSAPQAYAGEYIVDIDATSTRSGKAPVTPVNPLAAALVQCRVVRAALHHAGNT